MSIWSLSTPAEMQERMAVCNFCIRAISPDRLVAVQARA